MRLLTLREIPDSNVLKCSECYSKAPYVIELGVQTESGATIKLCGDCLSKAWDLYWNPSTYKEGSKLDVENFNTNLSTDINQEVFPR